MSYSEIIHDLYADFTTGLPIGVRTEWKKKAMEMEYEYFLQKSFEFGDVQNTSL